jgi:hypothetical protein
MIEEIETLRRAVARLEAVSNRLELTMGVLESDALVRLGAAPRDRLREWILLPDTILEPGMNLHSLEYLEDGTPFRWSGPDNVLAFAADLDRSVPLTLSLTFLDSPDPAVQMPLRVEVDGDPIAEVHVDRGVLTVTIPPNPGRSAYHSTVIAFVLKRTIRPANDNRLLGFGLISLHIIAQDDAVLSDPLGAYTGSKSDATPADELASPSSTETSPSEVWR